MASVTFFIGTASLAQDYYKINIGIDELLFYDYKNHNSLWPPGRPSPTTALSFVAISVAFFCSFFKRRSVLIFGHILTIVVWVLAFQAVVCYVEGVNASFGSALFTQMAFHTAMVFVLLSSDMIINGPAIGISSVLRLKTLSSKIIQALLAVGILLPPTLIWLKLIGVSNGWWTEDFGAVLVVICNVVFYSLIVYLAGIHIIKAEEVQLQAQRDLQYSIQLRDDFLSLASHELKTPLTSMKLQNQLLHRELLKANQDVVLSSRIVKFIEMTERQINRLNRLVDAMLDISRIDAKKIILHKEEFDLVSLLTDISESMSVNFHANECKIVMVPNDPIIGCWDRTRLEQVFLNLLSNACKYGQQSLIAVKFIPHDTFVIIEITNGGDGIATEDLERIFKRFERGTDINESTGLGLGLYITRTLLELHHGTIRVESVLGEGAKFIVNLPLKDTANNYQLGSSTLKVDPTLN